MTSPSLSFNPQTDSNSLTILGGGLFGVAFLTKSGIVIKAIKDADKCEEAEKEAETQIKICDALARIHNLPNDNPIVVLVKKYITASCKIKYVKTKLITNGMHFNCYIEMEKLWGIPFSVYSKYQPNFDEQFEKEYLDRVGTDDYNIMLHLSFNNRNPPGLHKVNDKDKVNSHNQTQGYFINKSDDYGILDFIRGFPDSHFDITNEQIKQVMGFVIGWIYFEAELNPFDIEFCLGYNRDENRFVINVLDFGMVVPHTTHKFSLMRIIESDVYARFNDPNVNLGIRTAKELAISIKN